MTARPPEGAVLDRRTLNRTLLARQHLLRRVAAPAADMVEHLVGLQAQVPRDSYISLWSRLRDFEAGVLEQLLLERRVVRMTLLRTTLHLVTARDAVPLRRAIQPVCERGYAGSPFRRQLGDIDLEPVLALGRSIVEERPRTIAELGAELSARWPSRDGMAMAYAVRYIVPLVQVTPRGLLRRSAAPRVTTLEAWLGEGATAAKAAGQPDDAVLRFLRAFGPATAADLGTWSGLTGVRSIVRRLRPRLRAYRDESGRELLDVEDGLFASPDEAAPARFTGEYDNVFLSHGDRSRITGDLTWGAAYARQGAFFVDGFLAGSWRVTPASGGGDLASLDLVPRRSIGAPQREAVASEGEGLLAFLVPASRARAVRWASP